MQSVGTKTVGRLGMPISFQPLNAWDDSLDEVRPWFGEGPLESCSEFLTGGHADGWNAHALTDVHEVEVRIGKIQ